jgi:hypothetical protein
MSTFDFSNVMDNRPYLDVGASLSAKRERNAHGTGRADAAQTTSQYRLWFIASMRPPVLLSNCRRLRD